MTGKHVKKICDQSTGYKFKALDVDIAGNTMIVLTNDMLMYYKLQV